MPETTVHYRLISRSPDSFLDLQQPRTIVIKQKDKRFVYHFRRLSDRDWRKYYHGILSQTENVAGEQVRTFDFRSSLLALVEETLERVEGYTGPGGASVEQLADWKLRLPAGHKQAAGLVLCDVRADDAIVRDESVLSDVTEVALSCAWTANPEGYMTQFSGLVHRFRHPSIEHLRRFNRESSRARVVGGSRTGKTIWPGRQELLADLYDQLIAAVDGYSFGAMQLSDQVEEIKRYMDMQHKVAAAQVLFAGGEDAEAEVAAAAEAGE